VNEERTAPRRLLPALRRSPGRSRQAPLGSWSMSIGVVGFAIFVLAAVAAPILTHYDPVQLDLLSTLQPPSIAHPFGTDHLGRDILARVIYGARIDLQIGLIGVAIPLVIGTVVGLVAGYFGRWADTIIGRVIDIVIAFPFLVLVIAIVAMLGPGLVNLYIAISVVSWVLYARIVRAETLAIRRREYILAAESLGYGHLRTMLRHILPNVVAPAFVFGMSDFVLDLQLGATLSFFGLGVQPPTPEWGLMIAETRNFMLTAPWTVLFPGLAIIAVSFFVSLIGDGLADRVRGLDER
jgi:peptide/nickel transport system permease protein